MRKIGMNIKLSGYLTYRHPFLCDQLHCISLELTAEMTILFPHNTSFPVIQILGVSTDPGEGQLEIVRFLGVNIEVFYTKVKRWQTHSTMFFPEIWFA
jgi:hypothetical protein